MQDSLDEIAALAAHATTQPTETALPGVVLIKGEVPPNQLAAIYEPIIGFTVQGTKTISIGDEVIRSVGPSYYVIPTDVPATGLVFQGPAGLPYLSIGLRIRQESLLSLLKDLPQDLGEKREEDIGACPASTAFVEAWLRMLRLLKTPRDIPALAPVYEREILYRALIGPQGWRLRQLGLLDGKVPGVHRAIQWLRRNFAKPMEVKRFAAKWGMGLTTFHRQFKEVTGLSPIQFQKQLRLLEARRLLAIEGQAAAAAAYAVGYQSSSQFNREYSRFFGAPPARDRAELRRAR